MKEKFKKVKDRHIFYRLLAEITGCDVQNVSTNWFARSYLAVPKHHLELSEKFLDDFLETEKKTEANKTKEFNQLHEKYFGN